MMVHLVKYCWYKNSYFAILFKFVLRLGQSDINLGHVFRISINGVVYNDIDVMSNKFNIGVDEGDTKTISHVKIYTSSPLKDSFSTNIGNVWNMIINGVVIKGI